jgi:hypothetical protein
MHTHAVGGHGGSDADEDEEEGEDELAEDAPEEVRLRRLAPVPQRQLPHLPIYLCILLSIDPQRNLY